MSLENGNEHEMGEGNDFPFEENEQKKDGAYTRAELEKLTGRELATIAAPLQKRFGFSSLKGKGKSFLIDIILGIKTEEVKEPKGKAPQTASESQNIIEMGLTVLQNIKQQREGQGAQLNPIAQELFRSSAVNTVDKARAEGALETDKFNTVIVGVSGLALAIDGAIGFENVPTLFSKLKSKLSTRANI